MGAVEIDTSKSTSQRPMSSSRSHSCQFFITLGPAPELNNRCTCFGKIVGESLFNALRIGEIVVEHEDKPVYEVVIERIEIIIHPYPQLKSRFSKIKVDEAKKDTDGRPPAPLPSTIDNDPLERERQAKRDALRQKIAALKEQIEGSAKKDNKINAPGESEEPSKPMSLIEKQRAAYKNNKKTIVGKRTDMNKMAQETLLSLVSFRHKLQQQHQDRDAHEATIKEIPSPSSKRRFIDICKLHGLMDCQSCKDTFFTVDNAKGDEMTDQGWMLHSLVFDRAELDMNIREDLKQLVVIDPRHQQKNKTKK